MKNSVTTKVVYGGIIAALYVVLTYVSSAVGLASGAIQVRLSECLTILPCLLTPAIPGLTVGGVLANLLSSTSSPLDVIFGSLATLLGAIGTRLLRKKPKLAWIPPVISNMIIVPLVLIQLGFKDVDIPIPFTQITLSYSGFLPLMITVGIGEIISCGILGMLVYQASRKAIPAGVQD